MGKGQQQLDTCVKTLANFHVEQIYSFDLKSRTSAFKGVDPFFYLVKHNLAREVAIVFPALPIHHTYNSKLVSFILSLRRNHLSLQRIEEELAE